MNRSALVLGSTGLIGRQLTALLAAHPAYDQVTLLGRRHLGIEDARLRKITCSLDEMAAQPAAFAVDDVFCCLGSTLKQAGSKAAFRKVDHDYCVEAARLAREQGARCFVMVSAVNANPHGLSFYARVKGEAERDIEALSLPSVAFVQPSLLQGERHESRPGERIGQLVLGAIKPLTNWSRAAWLPVGADEVARAMLKAALDDRYPPVRRLRYRDIRAYATNIYKRGET